tara:strand:+ start:286 stop:495 length:210 start_codon:yes stop_codon:yes gene_type:complete
MMATTKASSVLLCENGVLRKEDTNSFLPFYIVLMFSHGSPITLGELEGEEGFGNIIDRVYDKWYGCYDD